MAKVGTKGKGVEVRDGFNPIPKGGLSVRDLKKLAKTATTPTPSRNRKKVADPSTSTPATTTDDSDNSQDSQSSISDSTDSRSAYKMLDDMRYVYRKLRGKVKLKELAQSDDKQFLFMVKELMKIEASLMAADIRAKEKDNGAVPGQMVFVVLKGLQDEQDVVRALNTQSARDIKKISGGVLDPNFIPDVNEPESQAEPVVFADVDIPDKPEVEGNQTSDDDDWME